MLAVWPGATATFTFGTSSSSSTNVPFVDSVSQTVRVLAVTKTLAWVRDTAVS